MVENNLWNVDQLAAYLNITKNTVYKLTKDRRIPCFKIGKQLRFDPAAIRHHLFMRGPMPQQPTDDSEKITSARELVYG
jgi:excisionase family DNA binding protein